MVDFSGFIRALGGTPLAVATVNANPLLLASLFGTIVGLIFLSFVCWLIHWRTSVNQGKYNPWWRNLRKAEEGKGGAGARGGRK